MSKQPISPKMAGILLLLLLLVVLTLSIIPYLELYGAPRAAQLKVAIPASATPESTSMALAEATKEIDSSEATQSSAEVLIKIQQEPTKDPEKEKTVSAPAWEAAFTQGKAQLTLVISNDGDVDIDPCLVVPAIYDSQSAPIRLAAWEIEPEEKAPSKSAAGSEITPLPDVCGTGVKGNPEIYYDPGISIQPASASSYRLTLHFDPKQTNPRLPYSGRVDVYIPGAPRDKDEEPGLQAVPYQSLTFTIRSIPAINFASIWGKVHTWGAPFLTSLLELFTAFLVLVLLGFYGPPTINALLGKPSITLDKFTAAEEDKKGIDSKIKALLYDELGNLRGSGSNGEPSLTLADASEPASILTVPAKLKEQAVIEVAVNLLEYIFRPNIIKVTGQILQSSAKGAGLNLTLTLNRSGEILDTQTFWELDYSGLNRLILSLTDKPFDAYLLLAKPAAVWIAHKASSYVGDTDYAPMGTTSWQSHAYFASAMHIFSLIGQLGEPVNAKLRSLDLLNTSLSFDPTNPTATINQTRLQLESLDEEESSSEERQLYYDLAAANLDMVIAELESMVQQ
jgi:hypothetical protein